MFNQDGNNADDPSFDDAPIDRFSCCRTEIKFKRMHF